MLLVCWWRIDTNSGASLRIAPRFGTEGSEVRILSPRPITSRQRQPSIDRHGSVEGFFVVTRASCGGVPVGRGNHADFAGRLTVEVLRLGIVAKPKQDRTDAGQRGL